MSLCSPGRRRSDLHGEPDPSVGGVVLQGGLEQRSVHDALLDCVGRDDVVDGRRQRGLRQPAHTHTGVAIV